MNTTTILRSSLLAAALGAAFSAQAVVIALSSAGNFTAVGAGGFADENVLLQAGGYGALSTLHYDVVSNPGNALGGDFEGTGTYTGAGGTLDFSFVLTTAVFNGGTVSYDGAWTYTGGTSTYAGKTGSGTLAFNYYDIAPLGTSAKSLSIFSGNLEAVPEPASVAALGIGALGLLRRRKQA